MRVPPVQDGADGDVGRPDHGRHLGRGTRLVRSRQRSEGATSGDDLALRCLALKDGKAVWATNFPMDFKASTPAWRWSAHLLLKGDAVGGDDQAMVAFDKKTGGRKVTWAHPAFAGQMAHACNDKRVVCVSLAKA